MSKTNINTNPDVTVFLDSFNHPFRKEIEQLRDIILCASPELKENIKWNGPNYSHKDQDRITMKIQPPKIIQLIFHRGAKKISQPKKKLIIDNTGLLSWKENDRAIVSFKNIAEINAAEADLNSIIINWLNATEHFQD